MGTSSFYVVFFHSENGFVVGACFFCFCNFFLCHPQDVLKLYFVVYIYICNSVFHATESTGSTRCWNIKEGRWNQCRLTWHSIVSPPNLHFPKYHHYSIHTNTNTYCNTHLRVSKNSQSYETTFELLVSLHSPYSRKNRGALRPYILYCADRV